METTILHPTVAPKTRAMRAAEIGGCILAGAIFFALAVLWEDWAPGLLWHLVKTVSYLPTPR